MQKKVKIDEKEDFNRRIIEAHKDKHYYYRKKIFYKVFSTILGVVNIIFLLVLFIIFLEMKSKKLEESRRKYEVTFLEEEVYSSYIGNRTIASVVIDTCRKYDVDISLAIAIMKTESEFNPKAFNNKNTNGSIDRGLFQLNNRTFPFLKVDEFYDIETNIMYGVRHIRYCLDESKNNQVKAIAIYNAGGGSVSRGRVPEMTLNHINKTINYKLEIDRELLKVAIK